MACTRCASSGMECCSGGGQAVRSTLQCAVYGVPFGINRASVRSPAIAVNTPVREEFGRPPAHMVLDLASDGINTLIAKQKEALEQKSE